MNIDPRKYQEWLSKLEREQEEFIQRFIVKNECWRFYPCKYLGDVIIEPPETRVIKQGCIENDPCVNPFPDRIVPRFNLNAYQNYLAPAFEIDYNYRCYCIVENGSQNAHRYTTEMKEGFRAYSKKVLNGTVIVCFEEDEKVIQRVKAINHPKVKFLYAEEIQLNGAYNWSL